MAYGMRISDWSSDVCSSDLVAGPACRFKSWSMAEEKSVLKQLGSLFFGADASPPPVRRNSGRNNPAPKPAPVSTTSDISLPAKQIGRASCRERVCQYV